jgi:hypothetical protein
MDERISPRPNGAVLPAVKPPSTPSLPQNNDNKATPREIGVALEQLVSIFGRPTDWAVAAPLYLEALADIRSDLLSLAVKRLIRDHDRYMPTPAQIRAKVKDELDDEWRSRGPDDVGGENWKWRKTLKRWCADRIWIVGGPTPDHPGCDCPIDLLFEFGLRSVNEVAQHYDRRRRILEEYESRQYQLIAPPLDIDLPRRDGLNPVPQP